jgi:hypothetical protein
VLSDFAGRSLAIRRLDFDFIKSKPLRAGCSSNSLGEGVQTVQELLRHANSLVTMNLHAQAITDVKRKAQSRLVSMLLDDNPQNERITAIGTIQTYEKNH